MLNFLYTKDCISSSNARNASVLKTASAVCTLKNPQQMGHMVCTKPMVIAPFHNLLLVQVYP